MPLEAKVDSLEGLSDEVAENYTPLEEGGYQLKILSGYVAKDKIEDTGGLKSALEKERENVANLKRKAKALEEKFGGVDTEEYKLLKDQQREAEEREAEKKGEWEKLKQQMRDQHHEQLEAAGKETARVKKELERHLIDAQATAAINSEDGNVTLLLPHVKSLVKLTEEDGVFKAIVIDATGTPRVDADGNPLSIKALVSEMRTQDVYAGAFKGTGSQGGGTPPGDGGEGNDAANGGGTPPKGSAADKPRSQMTPREKVDYIKEHGNDKYQSLPA